MFGSAESIVNQSWRLRFTCARVISRVLAATLFPPRCCLCGFEGSDPDLDLCPYCQADLPWDDIEVPRFISALRFEPPADELIRGLKYAGAVAPARVLGEMLARAVRARGDTLPNLLVPVPLHDSRLRERGFNQALAITRFAGLSLGIPYRGHALRRVRDTPSQTGLNRAERRANVGDAFVIAGSGARDKLRRADHVAVIDDVSTTGSTLAEIQFLLLGAGVRRVDLWAAARAPRHRG